MAKQNIPRQQGDDYQARWFWLQACGLLDDYSKIERVVHEDDTLKSFDDVAVYYRSGYTCERGFPLNAHFYQVKFHVTSDGSLKADSLCDPKAIGATTHSLLQKMKQAFDHCSSNGIQHRLTFYTPWTIHPDDPLAAVHSQHDGGIRWDILAKGRDNSKMGKLRKAWREHLGLDSDDQLRHILASVRIERGPTLEELGRRLNDRLQARGLRPVDESRLGHPYDDLTRKMLATGQNMLTTSLMLDICSREGLLLNTPTRNANLKTLGIRSFLRWAEDMQNQTQDMVCLSNHFNGRHIRHSNEWNTTIPKALRTFIQKQMTRGGSYRLHLDAHSSVAFFVGYLLPEKMGIPVEVVQPSGGGTNIWTFTQGGGTPSDSWDVVEHNCSIEGTEWALAVSLTHNITDDVMRYVRESLPSIRAVVLATPPSGPSASSVRNGAHAEALASQMLHRLNAKAKTIGAESRVHLFFAAPNGFTFCLGRKMQTVPNWTLYEFDFGSGRTGAYSPSIVNGTRR